jgi:hypothetical protein
MSTFGAKESWMEPMNAFLNNHRNSFKKFLDEVCDVSSTTIQVNIPPSYSTPLAILNRLPPTSREGFPSLPHLIDHARSFATLVNLWLEHVGEMVEVAEEQTELLKFHLECLRLRKRTEECLTSAERAERPGSQNEGAWDDIVGQLRSDAATDEACSVTSTTHSQHTFFHTRTDSSSTSPSTITSSSAKQQTYPPILGIRSGSTVPQVDSPVTSRQQWRGPGRQLSLEILPSSRSALARDPFGTSTSAKAHQHSDSAGQQQLAASPASNTTSPFGTSPFGGSDGSADEFPGKPSSSSGPSASMSRSGRTTPSQYAPRTAADVRIHPWSYSMAREMAMRSGRGGSSTSAAATPSASVGIDDPGHDSSDGAADRSRERKKAAKVDDPSNGVSGRWRIGPTGERIFVRSKPSTSKTSGAPPKTAPATISSTAAAAEPIQRPDSAAGVRAPLSAAARQHLRERAERMEPGEHSHHHYTSSASPALLGSLIQRASTPSRQPRRDWAGEERRKREERNNSVASGLGTSGLTSPVGSASNSRRPSLQTRAYSDEPSGGVAAVIGGGGGYHSAGDGNTTGDDDDELVDEDMTALPSMASQQQHHLRSGGGHAGGSPTSTPTRGSSSAGGGSMREGSRGSGEKERKVLLKDMIFKKRRGP